MPAKTTTKSTKPVKKTRRRAPRKLKISSDRQGRLLDPGWLRKLGIYGYDAVEDVILAALVTGDPLLLIGKSGTGKTFLLNSLSEALGLEHRHYNASLIAFDDLVGFPYPVEDGKTIRYIETPATIWQAESVLIDELSRCKPEHQNRLFSLVHERRIQGLELPRLRYRWAAMNPCEQDSDDFYEGSVALDQALADRFAFVISVPDWDALEEEDRSRVADARGVDVPSIDEVGLAAAVEEGRRRFAAASPDLHQIAKIYSSCATSQLLKPKVRLSPRRARMLSRNLVALTLVTDGHPDSGNFQLGLKSSLPQPAWGAEVSKAVIRGAHATAWSLATEGSGARWLQQVVDEPDLARRCRSILKDAPSPDSASAAIRRSLVQLPPERAAVFALALFPAAQTYADRVGEEGVAALADLARQLLRVTGSVSWSIRPNQSEKSNPHPTLTACSTVLEELPPKRRARAKQLFYHCLTKEIDIEHPARLEDELNEAVKAVRPYLRRR